MIRTLTYTVGELIPYINWTYFFHTWGIPPRFAAAADIHDCPACRNRWTDSLPEEDKNPAREALRLTDEARKFLREHAGLLKARVRFGLFPARSEGDDILISGEHTVRLAFLRQQTAQAGSPCLCLADFIAPWQDGVDIAGRLGLFATTVNEEAVTPCRDDDDFQHLLARILCDRLAEAAAEKMHEEVRRCHWGYAPNECLTAAELFAEKYQGLRPAIGYPSLPDLSLIFPIHEVLQMDSIGICLTENGMMVPHASTCGLMFAHPAACHFGIGPIGEDQLQDYARRRERSVEEIRRFLASRITT